MFSGTMKQVMGLSGILTLSTIAGAQPVLHDAPPPKPKSDVDFKIWGAVEHMFETNINGGGDVEVTRAAGGIGMGMSLERDLKLNVNFSFGIDSYNFSSFTSLGGFDPWGDIHNLGISAIFTYQASNDWSLFAGPILQFSRESGANWGDSFAAGGMVGATFVADENLVIGGGIGMMSQIEDSARIFPVLSIDWYFTDNWKLSSTSAALAMNRIGLELVWEVGGGWEVGVGGAYRFRRFRLNDQSFAPDGAGQDISVPIWGRVSYEFNENVSFTFMAGTNVSGELAIDNNVGVPINKEEYDSSIQVGAVLTLRF